MAEDSPLKTAEIGWKEGHVPFSRAHDDVYYSAGDGLAESRHVFLAGNSLPEAWAAGNAPAPFVIAETGFGTGLNFLATWQAWRETRKTGARLHYVSLEGFPLGKEEIARALSPWTELSDLAAKLIARYPPAMPGFHRIHFDGDGIVLTLLFGEAAAMLAALEARVDAWFLDGFAPARNPDMWRGEVLDQVARLSRPGTSLASFTVAGAVRRDLAERGFSVEKAPGFGRKRDMLRARYESSAAAFTGPPWFRPPPPRAANDIAIAGAGIAGAGLARAFRRRGKTVKLIDPHPDLSHAASGNPAGIVMPRLTADGSAAGRFHAEAYRYALQEMGRLGAAAGFHACGVLELARDEDEAARQRTLAARRHLPEEMMRLVPPGETASIAGVAVKPQALFYPGGGMVEPRRWRDALIEGCAIETATIHDPASLEADAVILANALGVQGFAQTAHLPLRASRGQISLFPAAPGAGQGAGPQTVLTFGSYVTPALNGHHVVGATYDPVGDARASVTADTVSNERNLAALAEQLPALAAGLDPARLEGRAALRCTTPDRLPVAGPVPAHEFYESAYGGIGKGLPAHLYPHAEYIDRLHLCTGLGSRGLVTAPLLGEIVASQLLGEPWPVERELVEALHPARFWIRLWKKLGTTKMPP